MKEKQEKIKEDKFDEMAKSICAYMKEKGWSILALGNPQVHQEVGALKYNYLLTFRFTGKKL